MRKKFSTSWKSSKQPRKQRKYLANAPLHLRKKLVSTNLSKELRKKHGKKSIPLKKGDTVKIMRGKFKGKTGKIMSVKLKKGHVEIDGIQIKKKDGSKINIKFRASNLQIIELNLEDKRRGKFLRTQEKNIESKKEIDEKVNKKSEGAKK